MVLLLELNEFVVEMLFFLRVFVRLALEAVLEVGNFITLFQLTPFFTDLIQLVLQYGILLLLTLLQLF